MVNHPPNPAAEQGWIKSKDPKSGRFFFANTRTRTTQWNSPPGWVDEPELPPPPPPPAPEQDPLPSNWEMLQDPSTGKPFYIDHDRKITTWKRPTCTASSSKQATTTSHPQGRNTTPSNAFQRILSSASASQSNKQSSFSPSSTSTTAAAVAPARAASYTPSSSFKTQFATTPTDHQHHHHPTTVDFSDALPKLDYKVHKVADALRLECPHCDALFTLSKRRHHCRLCGDVFCDACSNHRVEVPLEGPEFEAPVRVCDFCQQDVEKGNFFTMRRYLTPLQLYDPAKYDAELEEESINKVATAGNVAAALSALTTDLDSLLHNSSSFEEKVTIPPDVLVPALIKHLALRQTSDRAVVALASLLALGSVVGNVDFAHCVYLYGGKESLDHIQTLLERSGADRKTLYVQEQAARAMYYLTDASILRTLTAKQQQLEQQQHSKDTDNEDMDLGGVNSLDMVRLLRSMLDHSSVSKNPNLQRWSAATLRNLIQEDERRTCLAANDVAAAVASGDYGKSLSYDSFLDQLVSTGGIMILCSLVGADDPDTRAHATGALGAVLQATRAVDASLATLREMTGQGGTVPGKDGDIIRAVVAGGGCGASLSQLLLSADHTVAGMGCDFAASLVMPLLQDARGTVTLPANYDCRQDQEGLGACREAALEMATGSCLPALLSLVRDVELGGRISRPMNLRKTAMETLAAVVLSVAEMAKANDGYSKLREAMGLFHEEGVVAVALGIMESSSSQSLVSSRDTPALRIREAAGIVLSSMAMCSEKAAGELLSRKAISSMLAVAAEADMSKPSTLRGDAAPRCLGMLETATLVLMRSWTDNAVAKSDLLDRLLEAVDAGAIPILSRILFQKMDWESKDKSAGGMKARETCCRMLAAMFAIARSDETGIGQNRLYEVVDADAYSREPPRSIITGALSMLQTSANYARRALMGGGIQGEHYHAALMDLVEASLLAVGSMCGASEPPGDASLGHIMEQHPESEEFKSRTQEACKVACDILVHKGRQGSLLPTMLVGGFGEGAVNASLRLVLAISQNGNLEQHAKLAMSGLLLPISDSLRNALSGGDLYRFSVSLALVRFCGPHVATGEAGGLKSVRDAIRVATNVLTLPVDSHADVSLLEMQESLKSECIGTLEALSSNASLWSAISQDALPSIVSYLHSSSSFGVQSARQQDTRAAALRAVLKIVHLPTHAVAAAQAGIAEPLAVLLRQGNVVKDETIPLLALEILHVLASNSESRKHSQLLEIGAFQAICTALGNSATSSPNKPSDSRADVAFWGLEILDLVISDLENGTDGRSALQSAVVQDILDVLARESKFLRALCATLLLQSHMQLPRTDEDGSKSDPIKIPDLYGPPLVLVQETCAGFGNTHDAAKSLLFSVSAYASASDSKSAQKVWDVLLVRNEGPKSSNPIESMKLAASFCAYFLLLLADDLDGPFCPTSEGGKKEFEVIRRPLVRHRLLEGLKTSLEELSDSPVFVKSVLIGFRMPQLCLSLATNHALFDLAYEMTRLMMSHYEDDILHLLVESKESLLSLLDMLNTDVSAESKSVDNEEIRRFVASILGSLAENGLLTQAVDRFGVRVSAISALASACLAEDEKPPDDSDDAPATSSRTSSRCMACLVELCYVVDEGPRTMKLSVGEAVAIAKNLGTKISQMVISRFLERAKLEEYNVTSHDDILLAPDVIMLCAVAQHEEALEVLGSIGGLNALSLIAAEGDLSAIVAIQKACRGDPSRLLEVDGHRALMALFGKDLREEGSGHPSREVEAAVFGTLAELCKNPKGRKTVTSEDELSSCLERATQVVVSLVPSLSGHENVEDLAVDGDERSESEVNNDERVKEPNTSVLLPEHTILECSAISFLASVIGVESCRMEILENKSFVDAALVVARSEGSLELRIDLLKFLLGTSQFAKKSEARLSVASLGDLFVYTITTPPPKSEWWKLNLLQSIAAEGLLIIFESAEPELQLKIGQTSIDRLVDLIKGYTVTRGPGTNEEQRQGARLACNLSLLLVQAMSKDFIQEAIVSSGILTSAVHLTQWRCDTKTSSETNDLVQWNAALCHCLQMLAFCIGGTIEQLDENAISLRGLASTGLMMSRPGRAPRKAIDFPSALRRIVEDDNKDAASCIAARRILSRLEDDLQIN